MTTASNEWGINERQLEDWFVKEGQLWNSGPFQKIWRQIPLNHGVLDVLAYDTFIYVIELKARPLKPRDVSQVLRYTYDVQRILADLAAQTCPIAPSRFDRHQLVNSLPDLHYYVRYHALHGYNPIEGHYNPVIIHPALVGTRADPNTIAAAGASTVRLYTWRYDELEDKIKTEFVSCHPLRDTTDDFPAWARYINRQVRVQCASEQGLDGPEFDFRKPVFRN